MNVESGVYERCILKSFLLSSVTISSCVPLFKGTRSWSSLLSVVLVWTDIKFTTISVIKLHLSSYLYVHISFSINFFLFYSNFYGRLSSFGK